MDFFGCRRPQSKLSMPLRQVARSWTPRVPVYQSIHGRYPSCLTHGEVQEQALQLSKKLFGDWVTLEAIIERHEEIIRRRWTKKSKEQKTRILLTAWPNMSPQHRPDVDALQRETPAQRLKGTRFREAYLWPYINIEDLVKPKLLLIFLNARGRHQPHEFVHSDPKLTTLGETCGACPPFFLNGYTMVFHGRTSPETYGELLSWDGDEHALELMMSGVGVHPGHGLQALEIQQRIWEFLVNCCKQLLQHVPSETFTSGDVQAKPEPLSGEATNITSLEIVAREAPYRIPAHLDFRRPKALVSAERNSREDHVWALREDPSYFASVMQEYAEHRQEQVLDVRGQQHPTFDQSDNFEFWSSVLRTVVVDAHFGFVTIDQILQQIIVLERLEAKYKDQIRPELELPSEFMKAFQKVLFSLSAAKVDIIGQLKNGVFPSPPIRPFCVRYPKASNASKYRVSYRSPGLNHAINRLMPFFGILWNEDDLLLFRLHNVVDEIERLIQADPEVKALIFPWVASKFSHLSLISECLHQLRLYQPWAGKAEKSMEGRMDQLILDYAESLVGWLTLGSLTLDDRQVYRYADPSDGKFNYPVHRRRNKNNTEAMRKAEKALDRLWGAVDSLYKRHARRSQLDMVADLFAADRASQRTPPWAEPVKEKKEPEASDYVYQSFSSVYHDHTKQITGAFNRTSLSDETNKAKTRGAAAPSDEPVVEAHTDTTAEPEPTYPVDKRAHKVFKALFYSPSNPDLPGEVPWTDFLHAMTTIGFSAMKLHGSAWNLTPPQTFDVERSIQFHEPHPSSKLSFYEARRFGRRLGRAYGWTGEMFKLE
ncbi:hypothetical protein BDV95DRAFT_630985 [Massariosphaeria phaeospora]|uniref:Uncharacterized protein n=1 Tax=Massariosphaeria phaeospora TaxID=100035 RepID=A0A7C8I0P0_9PLEO|nr:hypothetical protein BDV95DRAFT_630985 [Massariosphaeria phaeospora]